MKDSEERGKETESTIAVGDILLERESDGFARGIRFLRYGDSGKKSAFYFHRTSSSKALGWFGLSFEQASSSAELVFSCYGLGEEQTAAFLNTLLHLIASGRLLNEDRRIESVYAWDFPFEGEGIYLKAGFLFLEERVVRDGLNDREMPIRDYVWKREEIVSSRKVQ